MPRAIDIVVDEREEQKVDVNGQIDGDPRPSCSIPESLGVARKPRPAKAPPRTLPNPGFGLARRPEPVKALASAI